MSMTGRSIAVVGNPNCGKTTFFNALTGGDQRVGNWPGVTVERKEGTLVLGTERVPLVDLPGIYALLALSEDERVARDYILGREPRLVVDIVDATNLERNLFLTTQLLDMKVPMVVVLTMMDLAEKEGIAIDVGALSARLGCPVIGVNATDARDARRAVQVIQAAWREARVPATDVAEASEVENLAASWSPRLTSAARALGTNGRWLALKIIEGDPWARARALEAGALTEARIDEQRGGLEKALGDSPDVVMAEARYRFIQGVVEASLRRRPRKTSVSDRIDRVALNRWLGIPIFLGVMYLLFWLTINVGGAFIDFFDIFSGTLFVDGFGRLLGSFGTPEWLLIILANGLGGGVQTVATFIPIIFVMFFLLSLLEDSGYMARAAFVMDRFMRWIGLPGKSFVPMLVGFGCSVPAIMAARTLENRRDRYLTVFMTPFMSCGARLPVYALFGAAFFGARAGLMVFSLYLVGIVLAVLTGLLLKKTLFKGEASYCVMELPPYHAPRMGNIMRYSWRRLLAFITRAKYIVPIVALLAVLNSLGLDGSFGNEDTENSVLSQVGRTITPAFTPMGIEDDNWPATVGLFTGILAKEMVVGTLNSLYGQNEAAESAGGSEEAAEGGEAAAVESVEAEGEEGFSVWPGILESLASIPANLAGIGGAFADPMGASVVQPDQETVAEELGAGVGVFGSMRSHFRQGPLQAYAYLLFILIYFPCVAAFAAMTREVGTGYAVLSGAYLTILAWITATLFYQVAVGGSALWISVSAALLALVVAGFWWMGHGREGTAPRRLDAPYGRP